MHARQSRREMADLLGYTANYIYLLESGRKPITDELARRVQKIVSTQGEKSSNRLEVREEPTAYQCRIPEDCDLPSRMDKMQKDLHDVKGKLDTLLALLGGPLREAIGLEGNGKELPK